MPQAAGFDTFVDGHPEMHGVCDVSVGIPRPAGRDQQRAVTHDPAPERLPDLDALDLVVYQLSDVPLDDAGFEDEAAVGHPVVGPDHDKQPLEQGGGPEQEQEPAEITVPSRLHTGIPPSEQKDHRRLGENERVYVRPFHERFAGQQVCFDVPHDSKRIWTAS